MVSDHCNNFLRDPCLRQGYQDPNNCDVCKCPDGFTGDRCDLIKPAVNGKAFLKKMKRDLYRISLYCISI